MLSLPTVLVSVCDDSILEAGIHVIGDAEYEPWIAVEGGLSGLLRPKSFNTWNVKLLLRLELQEGARADLVLWINNLFYLLSSSVDRLVTNWWCRRRRPRGSTAEFASKVDLAETQ